MHGLHFRAPCGCIASFWKIFPHKCSCAKQLSERLKRQKFCPSSIGHFPAAGAVVLTFLLTIGGCVDEHIDFPSGVQERSNFGSKSRVVNSPKDEKRHTEASIELLQNSRAAAVLAFRDPVIQIHEGRPGPSNADPNSEGSTSYWLSTIDDAAQNQTRGKSGPGDKREAKPSGKWDTSQPMLLARRKKRQLSIAREIMKDRSGLKPGYKRNVHKSIIDLKLLKGKYGVTDPHNMLEYEKPDESVKYTNIKVHSTRFRRNTPQKVTTSPNMNEITEDPMVETPKNRGSSPSPLQEERIAVQGVAEPKPTYDVIPSALNEPNGKPLNHRYDLQPVTSLASNSKDKGGRNVVSKEADGKSTGAVSIFDDRIKSDIVNELDQVLFDVLDDVIKKKMTKVRSQDSRPTTPKLTTLLNVASVANRMETPAEGSGVSSNLWWRLVPYIGPDKQPLAKMTQHLRNYIMKRKSTNQDLSYELATRGTRNYGALLGVSTAGSTARTTPQKVKKTMKAAYGFTIGGAKKVTMNTNNKPKPQFTITSVVSKRAGKNPTTKHQSSSNTPTTEHHRRAQGTSTDMMMEREWEELTEHQVAAYYSRSNEEKRPTSKIAIPRLDMSDDEAQKSSEPTDGTSTDDWLSNKDYGQTTHRNWYVFGYGNGEDQISSMDSSPWPNQSERQASKSAKKKTTQKEPSVESVHSSSNAGTHVDGTKTHYNLDMPYGEHQEQIVHFHPLVPAQKKRELEDTTTADSSVPAYDRALNIDESAEDAETIAKQRKTRKAQDTVLSPDIRQLNKSIADTIEKIKALDEQEKALEEGTLASYLKKKEQTYMTEPTEDRRRHIQATRLHTYQRIIPVSGSMGSSMEDVDRLVPEVVTIRSHYHRRPPSINGVPSTRILGLVKLSRLPSYISKSRQASSRPRLAHTHSTSAVAFHHRQSRASTMPPIDGSQEFITHDMPSYQLHNHVAAGDFDVLTASNNAHSRPMPKYRTQYYYNHADGESKTSYGSGDDYEDQHHEEDDDVEVSFLDRCDTHAPKVSMYRRMSSTHPRRTNPVSGLTLCMKHQMPRRSIGGVKVAATRQGEANNAIMDHHTHSTAEQSAEASHQSTKISDIVKTNGIATHNITASTQGSVETIPALSTVLPRRFRNVKSQAVKAKPRLNDPVANKKRSSKETFAEVARAALLSSLSTTNASLVSVRVNGRKQAPHPPENPDVESIPVVQPSSDPKQVKPAKTSNILRDYLQKQSIAIHPNISTVLKKKLKKIQKFKASTVVIPITTATMPASTSPPTTTSTTKATTSTKIRATHVRRNTPRAVVEHWVTLAPLPSIKQEDQHPLFGNVSRVEETKKGKKPKGGKAGATDLPDSKTTKGTHGVRYTEEPQPTTTQEQFGLKIVFDAAGSNNPATGTTGQQPANMYNVHPAEAVGFSIRNNENPWAVPGQKPFPPNAFSFSKRHAIGLPPPNYDQEVLSAVPDPNQEVDQSNNQEPQSFHEFQGAAAGVAAPPGMQLIGFQPGSQRQIAAMNRQFVSNRVVGDLGGDVLTGRDVELWNDLSPDIDAGTHFRPHQKRHPGPYKRRKAQGLPRKYVAQRQVSDPALPTADWREQQRSQAGNEQTVQHVPSNSQPIRRYGPSNLRRNPFINRAKFANRRPSTKDASTTQAMGQQ